MLFSMAVPSSKRNEVTTAKTAIRACSADYAKGAKASFIADDEKASLCTTANRILESNHVRMYQAPDGSNGKFSTSHLLSAGRQLLHHLGQQTPSCDQNTVQFAYSQSAVIGLFAGVELHQYGISVDVLTNFLQHIEDQAVSESVMVQLCGTHNLGADYSIGIFATSAKQLPSVQKLVGTWSNGECVTQAADKDDDWMEISLRIPGMAEVTFINGTNSTQSQSSMSASSRSVPQLSARSRLAARADCKTTVVQAGDGCAVLASRCGISQTQLKGYNRDDLCATLVKDEVVCCSSGTLPSTLPPGNADGTCKLRTVVAGDDCNTLPLKCGISYQDFLKANTKQNLCSTLMEGQQVCCTAGERPDLKPKPDADGNCATHLTQTNEGCASIAVARDLEPEDLEEFNKNTWGWNGCDPENFYRDFLMCVSKGTPPMPATVPNAICGPMMPDTVKPPSGTNISELNPCPLNVCCNIWGQCGTTDDYCTVSPSKSGAPGTSGHQSGCISNCGRDIIKGPAPESKIKVAYFESWNFNRKCLTMSVEEIPSSYTHIHFAFANITQGTFVPEITDDTVKEQFEIFKQLKDVKKIISFGGWDFSTMPGTYSILRQAAQPANRALFAKNVVAFVEEHGLDGVDIDWEYPGAPDIPDVPSDDPQNGVNYYRLLSSIKTAIGSSKTVSFAAPASFWYLKSYPIKTMAKEIDYIIYMTYDLHGQWDYANEWTSPGCPSGNCLRSHVNETETKDALSMITKAGAVSNKVVVGVASYGRSFKMESAGCDDENCKFTGSPRVSNAYKGRCTDTGGYISNAEIEEIIDTGNFNKNWTKEGSNMLVFNDTEWVAYMTEEMKAKRSEFYDSYNFAGTTDWAVDLQEFWDSSGLDDMEDVYVDPNYWLPCTGSFSTLEVLEDRKFWLPHHCLEQYIVDVQIKILEGTLKKYEDLLDDGYDGKFNTYERYTKEQAPDQINSFMASDKVDDYFTCTEYKEVTCCSSCKYATCAIGCDNKADCKSGYRQLDMDKCPKFEFEVPALHGDTIPNATFTLNDETGFYNELQENFGIEKEWVVLSKRTIRINNGCQYAGEDVLNCIERSNNFFYNYPMPSNDKIKVYNPKDIINGSSGDSDDLLERVKIMATASRWDEELTDTDMVDSTSLPTYSMEQAVSAMQSIIDEANEIEKKEREEMILNFITGILFWVPFAGEIGTGLTALRSVIRLIGAVGDAALLVYDIVQDPDSAFMSVFSYLATAGVGKSGFKAAASYRRIIVKKDYESLGAVKTRLDKVESIRGSMCTL
ncbi:hypothetical protein SLS60_005012 [Paraconiothyrium brasiliense]|uniref:chitinase n=1 Tax=Paraconiothyrium brasiliense TaxID=300254 RepID=A0ABR3RG50_9PLEO